MLDISEMLDAPTDEERMIADGAAAFHDVGSGLKRIRALRSVAPGYDLATWKEMAALGWLGLTLPEEFGGSAGTLQQMAVLAEHMGRALAPEPLVPSVVLAAGALLAGAPADVKERVLPQVAEGSFTLALGWAEPGRGQDSTPLVTRIALRSDGARVSGSKCFIAQGGAADAYVVSARGDNGPVLCLIDAGAKGLSMTQHVRVDGGFWTELALDEAPAQVLAEGAAAERALNSALDTARIMVSAELMGVMARAFEMSVQYIGTREQFGQPIGAFQALQHLAVNQLLQLEIARAVLLHGTRAFEATEDPDRRALIACRVKARCSDAALKVTRACIQLHGGIGYTDEADIGLYLKRAMVLAAWLGGAEYQQRRYAQLCARGVELSDEGAAGQTGMAEVRAWLEENFPRELRFPDHRLDASSTREWQKTLAAKGWVAPNWPTEYGGMGLSAFEQVQFQEECDRVGMNMAPPMGVTMLGPLLIRYGTEAQRKEHLPKILSGEVRWCQGYSEPGAGSDLASLRTTAELDGDHFIVNGQKIWTSFAYEAQKIFMLVRTDKNVQKQKGISFLLADMDTPGITVRRIVNLTGSGEFCEVFFDNVRVPRENLVGPLNEGWKMAKALLGSERIMIGSPRLSRYPLRLLGDYARTRGLDQDPHFNARYTGLLLDIEDLGSAFVRMVDALRRGREPGPALSILKIWNTDTLQRVTDLMLEVAGEDATTHEAVVTGSGSRLAAANVFLAARAASIYAGSNEIQRNILAKAVLQLPGA